MDSEASAKLLDQAADVLKQNDRGGWTVPSGNLYPHQWLWDSCFISIGLRHIDIERAQTELRSLLRGQWANGMLPHMVLSEPEKRQEIASFGWRSYLSPYAPEEVSTSGITQPPLLAEAVLKIGQALKSPERRTWYKEMLPALIRYHEWLYNDRDPHREGLVLLLHPYECGLDNTPGWISELRKHSQPWWISALKKMRADWLINRLRRDTKRVNPGERMDNIDAIGYWAALRRLRRKAYNTEALLSRSQFAVEDLAFNSIFIRANECLNQIAKAADHELPEELVENMERSAKAIEDLWDDNSGLYYSRNFATHKLIEEPSIESLLPLYSGAISKNRAAELVEKLKDKKKFALKWPVPSVPRDSSDFDPYRYWQGPAWVNTNWLIIEGLKKYGFGLEAKELRNQTIQMVAKSGFNEYFSPLDASPAGARNFSWTAALTIDLLKQ